jgi:hypothetical protein
MSVVPIRKPDDAALLRDGLAIERRVLKEAEPPVEDIRNALAMCALATTGTSATGGHLVGFSVHDLEAIERLLRAAVVKLDAIRGHEMLAARHVVGVDR